MGERVVGLVGSGTADDPVKGVVLKNGETIEANMVFGADGRGSVVASALGLQKRAELAGDQSMLYSYWVGVPEMEQIDFVVRQGHAFNRYPCEDDVQIVTVGGDATFARGSPAEREQKYAQTVDRFADFLDPTKLAEGRRISKIYAAPETMLRGYFRQAAGPGWALVGDSGHFKHPATAQSICDAIEQALWIAEAVTAGDAELSGYEKWRDERAEDHYHESSDGIEGKSGYLDRLNRPKTPRRTTPIVRLPSCVSK